MAIENTLDSAELRHGRLTQSPRSVEYVRATDRTVLLTDGGFLADATFRQQGDDLLIVAGNGDAIAIRGYFLFDPPPAIETLDGGWFPPQLVRSFTLSEAAGQYAQAGPAAGGDPVGQVQIASGNVVARRADGTQVGLRAGDPIFQGDVVETGADSTVNLIFVDDTTFTLGGEARLAIDELVYNPATRSGTSTLSILKGAFVFVSGQIAQYDYTEMQINTPVATIGIRGTTVAGDVKAPGERSQFTVIDGEIDVSTRVASVTLNDEFETTYVESFNSAPTEPFILTEDQIERDYGEVKEASGGFYDGGALEEIAPEAGGDVTQSGEGPILAESFGFSFTDFSAITTRLDFLGLLEQFRLEIPGGLFSSGSDGDDVLLGGAGETTSFGQEVAESTSGNDVINGLIDQPNTIDGGGGDDTITGGNLNDLLAGGEGNDRIDGGQGDDVLFGGAGDDLVFGGDGDDVLIGGSGNGNDFYDGGAGVDTVRYTSAVNPITVDLGAGTAQGDDIDFDVLSTIERVVGGEGDDVLIGADGGETLEGRGGRDTLIGGAGDDTLIGDGDGTDLSVDTADYSAAAGPITVDFTAAGIVGGVSAGIVSNGTDVGTDVIVGIERIVGTDAADSFFVGSDFVSDFTDYVEFDGRGGDDFIVGNGATRIAYRGATAGVEVDLAAGTTTGDASVGSDSFTDVNQAVGSAFDDTLVGSNATDDTLLGGDGADFLDGRGGFDLIDYIEAGNGVTVDLSTGQASDDGFGNLDTLVEIEAVRGSANADTLIGDAAANLLIGAAGDDDLIGAAGDDTLRGGDGADTLDGGLGDDTLIGGNADGDSAIDTVDYSGASEAIAVDLTGAGTIDGFSAGSVVGNGSVGTDTVVGIERIVGTDFDDVFIVDGPVVSDFTDYVEFEGGGGNDTITGNGETRVSYRSAAAGVTVDLAAGTGDGDASVGSDIFLGGVNQAAGSAHDDTLFGSDLSDTLQGNAGNDFIDGGGGSDLADYWNSAVGVRVDLSAGVATEDGFGGSDALVGIEGARGSEHDDILTGDGNGNRLIGGGGNDGISGGDGADLLFGDAGQDSLSGGAGDDTLSGGSDMDTLTGGAGADRLEGDAGDDRLQGGDGADLLLGGAGDDTLEGGADNDSLVGGDGADTIIGEAGNDNVVGGGGIDRFDASAQAGPLSVNLAAGTAVGEATGTDLLSGIEDVATGSADDTVVGDGADNRIELGAGNDTASGAGGIDTILGGAGDDLLDGGGGNDVIDGGSEDDTVTGGAGRDVLDGGSGADRLDGGADSDTLDGGTGDDTLRAGDGNDLLVGGDGADDLAGQSGDDVLDGGVGNDIATGGAGNDLFVERDGSGDDDYDGGSGVDTLDYTAAATAVAVDLEAGTATGTGIGDDVIAGFEDIRGGAGDDTLSGDSGANTLSGSAGADAIDGRGGDDVLSGGSGNDTLAGGLGNDRFDAGADAGDDSFAGGDGVDTIDFNNAADAVTVDLADGTAQSASTGADSLTGIERAVGGAADDTLLGDAGANTLEGGAGADILSGAGGNDLLFGGEGDDTLTGGAGDDFIDGGAGSDTVDYSAALQNLIVDLEFNIAVGDGTDIFSGIEHAIGGSGGDTIVGGAGENTISGGDGADTLDGGDGADVLFGDAGGDILFGGDAADTLSGGAGDDQLNGNDGADRLDGGDGIDRLFGDAGDDTLDGGAGADALSGGAGDDLFFERDGSGNDNYDGGTGNDTIDYSEVTAQILLNLDTGDVTVLGGGSDTITNIETVIAGRANDTVTGGDASETLSGGDGNDTLFGGGGDDRFIAVMDAGDDDLNGGEGVDTLDFTGTNGAVTVDVVAGSAISAEFGTDTIANIENFIGGAGDDNIAGAAGDETLQGGAGDDVLNGGAGDDSILGGAGDDTIVGGAGSDHLAGGSGFDTADYSAASDAVSIDLSAGTAAHPGGLTGSLTGLDIGVDTIVGFERVLTGSGGDIVAGSAAGETIDSGAGQDTIAGGGGDDTLTGGADADTVFGGAGDDRLMASFDVAADTYSGGSGIDTLDYGALTVGLSADLAAGTVVFPAGIATVSDTVLGIEVLVGGSGGDTISGTQGDDTLIGGLGDDTLSGIGGTDHIEGGDGNDLIVAGSGGGQDFFDGGDGNDVLDLSGVDVDIVLNLADGSALAAGGQGIGSQIINIEQIRAGGGDDTIVGSSAADTIDGGGGRDSIFAAGGNDHIVFDPEDATVDGGAGVDRIAVVGGGLELDATVLANSSAIEAVDLSGNGVNSFMSDPDLVRSLSDTGTISVTGNGDDRLVTDGSWSVTGSDNALLAANAAELHVGVATLSNVGAIDFSDGGTLAADRLLNGGILSVDQATASIDAEVANEAGGTFALDAGTSGVSLEVDSNFDNAGLLALNGVTADGSLSVLNGSLANSGLFSVESGVHGIDANTDNTGTVSISDGTLKHLAGDIANSGTYAVDASGVLAVGAAAGPVAFVNAGAIAIDGTFTLNDTSLTHQGNLSLGAGAVLSLGGGSSMDFQTDFLLGTGATMLVGNGASGLLLGDGTVTNQGDMLLDNGTLGVELVNEGGLRTSDDIYRIEAGMTLTADGSIDLTDSKTLTGAGTVVNQSDLALDDDIVDVTFIHRAGVLDLSRALAITGELVIEDAGNANTGSEVAIEANSVLDITGSFSVGSGVVISGDGTLDNTGEVLVSGGTLSSAHLLNQGRLAFNDISGVVTSGSLTNAAGGEIEAGVDVDFNLAVGETLTNLGLIDVDAGTFTFRDAVLANSGTLDVAAGAEVAIAGGTLSLLSGGTLTGGGEISFASALDVAAGVEFIAGTDGPDLQFTNGDLVGDGTFSNDGLMTMAGGTIGIASFVNLDDGTLQIDNGTVVVTGDFANEQSGIIEILSGTADAALVLPGGFGNHGIFNLIGDAGNTGVIDLGGDTLTNHSGGVGAFSGKHVIDGAVVNLAGSALTVASPFEADARLTVTGGMINAGNIFVNTTGGLGAASTLDFGVGSLTNLADGQVRFGGGGGDPVEIIGNIDNQGTINVSSDGQSRIRAAESETLAVSNTGTVNVGAGKTLTIGEGATSDFTNSGVVEIDGVLVLKNTVLDQSGVFAVNTDGSLGLAEGSTLDLGAAATIGAQGTLGLGDGGVAAASVAGSATLENNGLIAFDNGTLSGNALNLGTVTTGDGTYVVSGLLSTEGAGAVDLDDGKVLAGGGVFEFGNDVDLTDDTISATTTVSIADAGSGILSNTTADGVLFAADGATLTFDGLLTGSGTFDHAAQATTLTTQTDIATLVNSGAIVLAGGTLASGDVENSGLLSISAASIVDAGAGAGFANSGTVAVQSAAEADFQDGLLSNAGLIDVAANGILSVSGGVLRLESGATLSGTGEIRFGGDLDIAAGLSFSHDAPALVFDGGNVTGDGTLRNEGEVAFVADGDIGAAFINEGLLSLTAATVTVDGGVLSAGGTLSMANARLTDTGGTLLNAGLVSVGDGTGVLDAGALVNDSGGVIAVTPDAILDQTAIATLSNAGLLQIDGSMVVGTASAPTADFDNTGTVSVTGDLLLRNTAFSHDAGTLDIAGGNLRLAEGSTLDLGGDATIGAAGTLALGDGGASVLLSGTGTMQNAGVFQFDNGIVAANVVNLGVVSSADARYDVSGSLSTEGAGTVSLSGGNTLTGGGTFRFANEADLTEDTVDASTTVSVSSGSTLTNAALTLSDTTVDGELIAAADSTVAIGGALGGSGTFSHAAVGSTLSSVIEITEVTNSGTLTLSGGTLASADAFNTGLLTVGTVSLIDPEGRGTFTNSGTVAVEAGGSLTFGDSDLDGTFANSGTLDIEGAMSVRGGALESDGEILLGGVLSVSGGNATNDGVLNFAGGTLVVSESAAFIQNQAVTLAADSEIHLDSGRLDGSGTVTVAGEIAFDNNGVLAADAVNLGLLSTGNGRYNVSGLLSTQEGGTLDLDGTARLRGGGTYEFRNTVDLTDDIVTGNSTVSVADGGSATLSNTNIGSELIVQAGGSVLASGRLRGNGTFDHSGSDSTVTGLVDIATMSNSGTLLLSGGTLASRTADNSGLLTVDTASVLDPGTGGTFSNSGEIAIGTGSVLTFGDGDEDGVFSNSGTLDVDGTLSVAGGIAVNVGVLNLDTGLLSLSDGAVFNQKVDETAGGDSTIELLGGTLGGAGTLTLEGALSFGENGLLALNAVNTGSVSTANDRYDVSALLSTAGTGTVDMGGTVTLTGGGTFAFANRIDVTDDIVAGNTTLSVGDGGTVTVSNTTVDGVFETGTASTVDFDGALDGAGRFDHAASGATLTSTIDIAEMTNSGVLNLSGGTLSSTDFTNSGLLRVGTPSELSPGAGGTVTNTGTIDIQGSTTLTFGDGLLDNDGVIDFSGNGTLLVDAGTVRLGSGSALTGNGEARFAGNLEISDGTTFTLGAPDLVFTGGDIVGSGTLVNDGNVTFTAAGDIGSAFVNSGLLSVSDAALTVSEIELAAGGTLTLDGTASLSGTSGALENLGLVRVDSGTGTIDVAAFSNASDATIAVASDATLVQTGGTVTNDGLLTLSGGTMTLNAGALFDQINDLTLGASSEIALNGGTLDGDGTLTVEGELTFANDGVLSLTTLNEGVVSSADGRFDVGGTLLTQNGGTVVLTDATTLAGGGLYDFAVDLDLTNDTIASLTTVSAGASLTVSNTTVEGVLIATDSADVAFAGNLTGTGTFEHEADGSTLTSAIDVASLTNSGELIVEGGTLSSAVVENTGTLALSNGSLTSGDVANSGLLDVVTSSIVDPGTAGTFSNSGTIDIADSVTLGFDNGVLENSGEILLSGTLALTNGVATNSGTLDFDTGTLALSGGAIFSQNVDVTLGLGSEIEIDSATLDGSGTLDILGAVSFAGNGALGLDAVNEGTLSTTNDRYDVAGTLVTRNGGSVELSGAKTLAGGGVYDFRDELELTDDTVAGLTTVSAGTTLTVSGTTVEGTLLAAGTVGVEFAGNLSGSGAFQHAATGSTLTTVIDVATLTNSGVLTVAGGTVASTDASNTGTLALSAGTLTSAGLVNSGLLDVAASSVVDPGLGGTVANSGTVDIADGAILSFDNGFLSNGGLIDLSQTGTLAVAGGTLALATGGTLAAAAGSASVSLDGGEVLLQDSFALEDDLTLAAGGTLGNTLEVGGFTFTNSGVVDIAAGSSLTADGSAGAFVNQGVVSIGDGGTLAATGLAVANEGGVVEIGADIGLATVDGDISFDFDSTLFADFGSDGTNTVADKLAVNGDATLGGTLVVSESGTVTVGASESFTLVAANGGTLTNDFDRADGLVISDTVVFDLVQTETAIVLESRSVTQIEAGTVTNLTGTDSDEVLVGKDSNNTIDGGGGADLMHGGGGNDVFKAPNTGFGRIDGGEGNDRVMFTAATSQTFNLTGLRGDQLSNIESIDITDANVVGLVIDVETVLSATSGLNPDTGTDHTLVIDGEAGNTITASGGWSDTGTVTTIDGEGYTVFASAGAAAHLAVHESLTVNAT